MEKREPIGKIILLSIAGAVFLLIMTLFLIPERVTPVLDSEGQPIEGAISLIERIELGGIEQALIIRGASDDLPVVLEVHGGPGSPEFGAFKEYLPELESHFLMVHWEQRGTAKSFYHPESGTELHPEQFVDDLIELTAYLKERFQVEKIILLGHSWGSYLTMRAAYENPEDYYAVINCGQLVNFSSNELVSYQAVLAEANKRGDEKAVAELEALGEPVNGAYSTGFRGMGQERNYVMKYGFTASGKDSALSYIKSMVMTPEYSFIDKINYFRGNFMCLREMLGKYDGSIDLFTQVPELKVPYYLFQGIDDYQTPFPIAEAYFEDLRAKNKEMIAVENAAHLAIFEQPEQFMELALRVRESVID